MQATPTVYSGTRFRSWLESRWAGALDSVGLDWRYEPVTFRSGRRRYTPDFSIDGGRIFVEVKGVARLNRNRELVYLCQPRTRPLGGHPLIIVLGAPDDFTCNVWARSRRPHFDRWQRSLMPVLQRAREETLDDL